MNSFIIAGNIIVRTVQGMKGWLVMIILPAVIMSIVISVLGQEPPSMSTIYYMNEDQGALGKYVVSQIETTPTIQLTLADNEESLREAVLSRQTSVAFKIPVDFTENMYSAESGELMLYRLNLDELSFSLEQHLHQSVMRIEHSIKLLKQLPGGNGNLSHLVPLLDQQDLQQVHAEITDYELYINPVLYLVTGFLLMFMMYLINNSVTTVLEDRKQKTLARVYTAPVRSYEITLGVFMGSMTLGLIQITAVLAISRYALGFNYGLAFLPHLIILTAYLLAIMGIASAIAGLIRNSSNAGVLNTLIVVPMCMLGGCFWSIELMPDFMQKIANFVPHKWTIEAIEKMSAGASLSDIWMHLSILVLFAIILLGFGSVILKPNENHTA